MRTRGIIRLLLAFGVLTSMAWTAHAADAPEPEEIAGDRTPPRLSFADGQVSFWRPGAQDWVQAQVNTPLAPGDELSTGSPGNLELQIGPRAFVRAWANTQIGLENQEPDYLQFKVTAGTVAFELRRLDPGHTLEVDTPNAAFTIEHSGYYRIEVKGERTSLITRRGGRATLTPASGEAVDVTPSEEVVVEGTASPQVRSYVAPPQDDWDRWNYARSDSLLDAVSARYVAPGTYGVDDLDVHGTWRVVPSYGSVWVPTGVQPGWAPYTTGSWTLDPFYGWTWVDTAPWGWAPYHHGRWVFVNGFWAWAPGPVVARPVYAPALVAFFGGPGVHVSIGGPVVGWVPLGWGEPVVPWWGRPGFVRKPWWGGWGGPRVVNNTVISNTTVVNVQNITVYHNTSVQNAVVAVSENRFGHGPITRVRVTPGEVKNLQPIHTPPQVAASPASFVPRTNRGFRPPEDVLKRPVVATRAPHAEPGSAPGGERRVGPAGVPAPAPRIVSVPQQRETGSTLSRPPFGQSTVERPKRDREQPPTPPRPEGTRRPERGSERTPPVGRQESPQPSRGPQPQAVTPVPTPAAPQGPAARPQATLPPGAPGTRQGPPQPSPGSQAVTPAPGAPQAPAQGATPAPPVVRRPESPPAASPAPTPAAPQGPAARPQAPSAPITPGPRQESPQASRGPQAVTPTPAAPQSPAKGAVATPPVARRPEAPPAASPAPTAPQFPAGGAAPAPPVVRRPEAPAAASPAPTVPQGPAARTPAPSIPGASGARQMPPQASRGPQAVTPAPAAPQPPARAATPAPPAVRRPEAAAPPARALPGEPANRLAPNRAEGRQPQKAERQPPRPPQGQPKGAPEKAQQGGGG